MSGIHVRGGVRKPIPTLGHPSQKAAIIALYEDRVEPRRISEQTGAPVNSVHRAIHEYRVATGRHISPVRDMPRAEVLGETDWGSEYKRRMAAYRRAVEGARKAREAAGL